MFSCKPTVSQSSQTFSSLDPSQKKRPQKIILKEIPMYNPQLLKDYMSRSEETSCLCPRFLS